ncbi:hypothetical protein [Micromonospora sp. DT47]|uniref:hypothetical protein n=1 Tax=Micromonospora sp. DT47 TaxID=3393431 RepID=UPI003CEC74F3
MHVLGRIWAGSTGVRGFNDFVIDGEDLADELADWNRDRFAYRGKTLRVEWLDDITSRRLRVEVFGIEDNAG